MNSREWILHNVPKNADGVSPVMGFRDGVGPRTLRICAHCDKEQGQRAYSYAMRERCAVTHSICPAHCAEVMAERVG